MEKTADISDTVATDAMIQALCRLNRDAVLLTRPDGTGICCNAAFATLLHISPDRIPGRSCEEIFQEATSRGIRPDTLNNWMHRALSMPATPFEDTVTVPFSPPWQLCLRSEPITVATGEPVGLIWCLETLHQGCAKPGYSDQRYSEQRYSEQRHSEEAVSPQKPVTQELLPTSERSVEPETRAIGMLATGIAHDLRNILTALHMELAELEPSPCKASAARQVNRLHVLTYALLALSQDASLTIGPVDLREIVNFVCGLLREQAEMDGVLLRTDLPDNLPRAQGNARRLEHLFVVLLRNALTATFATGGTVTVSASVDAGRLRIDIQDNGPGILPENLPHLFEQFFTTQANRTGLGLFSAKRIVEAHRGEISVASQPGQGTCVSVWLAPVEAIPVEAIPVEAIEEGALRSLSSAPTYHTQQEEESDGGETATCG